MLATAVTVIINAVPEAGVDVLGVTEKCVAGKKGGLPPPQPSRTLTIPTSVTANRGFFMAPSNVLFRARGLCRNYDHTGFVKFT